MADYFPKRLLYYWAKNYQAQLRESEQYHKLEKVTLICVSKNSLPIATTRYYNHFQVVEANDKLTLCDDLQIHTIELPKFLAASDTIATPLELWTYFFKHGEDLDDRILPEPLAVPVIQQAVKELTMFTQDQMQRELYEARLKATLDYNSMMYEKEMIGLKKGKEEGLKEGEQIGIQKGEQIGIQKTVVNALKSGLDVDTIHKITGVSKEEIRKLQKQTKDR
jgi:predicted transposase/invertase (TIGR01784 family)